MVLSVRQWRIPDCYHRLEPIMAKHLARWPPAVCSGLGRSLPLCRSAARAPHARFVDVTPISLRRRALQRLVGRLVVLEPGNLTPLKVVYGLNAQTPSRLDDSSDPRKCPRGRGMLAV